MKTIGVGVIGWGFMGSMHTHSLTSLPLMYPEADFRARLECVCSRRLEKAEQAARDMGFRRATDDYRELLRMPEVEVVSICTPNALHEEMAVAALEAGKHVYIDKPLSVTLAGAQRIAEAAAKSGTFTKMALNLRHFPATMRARELVEAGAIGEILQFSARYLHSGSVDRDRPISWKHREQGGVLLDLGSHALDLATWLCGYPEQVFGSVRVLYPSRPTSDGGEETRLAEDHALMLLRLPNGALGQVEASKIATGTLDEVTLEIRGSKGAIEWRSMQPNYLGYFDQSQPEKPLGGLRGFTWIETAGRYAPPGGKFVPAKNAVGWDRSHIDCYYDFLDCVAHGRRPENGVEQGARLQRLMRRVLDSHESGRWERV